MIRFVCAAFTIALAVFSIAPLALDAQQSSSTKLHTTIDGTVLTYQQGWATTWITSCNQLIKPTSGTLGGYRNVTNASTSIAWSFNDALSGSGGSVVSFETPGLAPGAIVTLPSPGAQFTNGLTFNCVGGSLPATPSGAPGPILVFWR